MAGYPEGAGYDERPICATHANVESLERFPRRIALDVGGSVRPGKRGPSDPESAFRPDIGSLRSYGLVDVITPASAGTTSPMRFVPGGDG